jgi:hypothetical protein
VVVLHLGDHDPSGLDMTRDITDRLDTFTTQDYLNAHGDEFDSGSVKVSRIREQMAERCNAHENRADECVAALEVRRIALTWDQVQEYQPPPNPAKMTDSRIEGYLREYGNESWELDALDPSVLDGLITSEVDELIDAELFAAAERRQETAREALTATSERWTDIVDFLSESA